MKTHNRILIKVAREPRIREVDGIEWTGRLLGKNCFGKHEVTELLHPDLERLWSRWLRELES